MEPLPFVEAIRFARKRGVVLPEIYYGDLQGIERTLSFSVASLAKVDQLVQIRDSLARALEEGGTFAQWKKAVSTGEIPLDLPKHRLENIFRTNVQTAYNRGRCEQQSQTTATHPFYLYDAVNDDRARPAHAAMDGFVARHDDPIWRVWTPPCGYQCRCRRIALTPRQAARFLEADAKRMKHPVRALERAAALSGGPDAGWDYSPCDGFGEGVGRALDAREKREPEWAEQVKAAKKALVEEMAGQHLKAFNDRWAAVKLKQAMAQLAVERGQLALAASEAKVAARAAQWKYMEAVSGDLGTYYKQAAKIAGPDTLDAIAAELKAKANKAALVQDWIKAKAAGKKPSKGAQAAFEELDGPEQLLAIDKVDAKVAATKAKAKVEAQGQVAAAAEVKGDLPGAQAAADKAVDAASDQPMDFRGWTQTGPREGTNPGGYYRAPDGTDWYVKWPPDADRVRNEVLTGRLYQLAGVEVPELRLVSDNGKIGVASRIVEGLRQDADLLRSGKAEEAWKGFATDAWLANWDVVGYGYDNLKLKGAKVFRVDTGGGLLFRAQGLPKGAAFGGKVTELDTLRDPNMNPQAASVFKHLTEEEIKASVARVIQISDDEIRSTVMASGLGTVGERKVLADLLISRKADLAARFPAVAEKVEQHLYSAKVALGGQIEGVMDELDSAILTAIRGAASRHLAGADFEPKDFQRLADARAKYASLTTFFPYMEEATRQAAEVHYGKWLNSLDSFLATRKNELPGFFDRKEIQITNVLGVRAEITPTMFAARGQLDLLTDRDIGERLDAVSKRHGTTNMAWVSPQDNTGKLHLWNELVGKNGTRAVYSWTRSDLYNEVSTIAIEARAKVIDAPIKDLPTAEYIEAVDVAIRRAADVGLNYTDWTRRGLTFYGRAWGEFLEKMETLYRENKPYQHPAPASSGKGTGYGGNVKLIMRGKTNADVSAIAEFGTTGGGGEVLWPTDVQFRITKITKLSGGNTEIWLEEIE